MMAKMENPVEFLRKVLTTDLLYRLYEESGAAYRKSIFHPALVVWLMMYQRIGKGKTLSEIIKEVRNGIGGVLLARGEEVSLNTSGYSQARSRLPLQVVEGVGDSIEAAILESHSEQTWHGYRVFNLDGTDFRVRARKDINKVFPAYREGQKQSPWSTIRSCVAIDLMTGVAIRPESGAMYGDNAASEVGLGKKLLQRLPHKSVIVIDRGFGTFSIAYTAQNQHHHVLCRLTKVRAVQANGGNKRIQQDSKITWKATAHTLGKHTEIPEGAEIEGRLISITLRQKGFKPIPLILFTTLSLSLKEILELYKLRWEVETDLRTIKSTIEMELLDVKSVPMALKEIILGIAGYNMICHLRAYAAKKAKLKPRDISFSQYCDLVQSAASALGRVTNAQDLKRLKTMLSDYAHQMKLPKRKKRPTQPRKVLRQPEPFPYLKANERIKC